MERGLPWDTRSRSVYLHAAQWRARQRKEAVDAGGRDGGERGLRLSAGLAHLQGGVPIGRAELHQRVELDQQLHNPVRSGQRLSTP